MQLSDFKTANGLLTIAPFDHRGSLAESLHLDLSQEHDRTTFLFLKTAFMKLFSPHVSAVLTDPEFGPQTLSSKAPACRVFLSLERSGYTGNHDAMTELLPDWGIDGVLRYEAGAKLLVYVHPQSNTTQDKIALVQRLYQEAKAKNVVFLVEPVLYELEGKKQWEHVGDQHWIEQHLEVCRLFSPHCDILKVQYPGSQEACERVSQMHKNWILLSRGVPFDEFSQYLTIARRSGCVGYAAGRAVWQELTSLPKERWEEFLQTVAVPRLQQLTKILETSTLVA